jgi:hypothetical protein
MCHSIFEKRHRNKFFLSDNFLNYIHTYIHTCAHTHTHIWRTWSHRLLINLKNILITILYFKEKNSPKFAFFVFWLRVLPLSINYFNRPIHRCHILGCLALWKMGKNKTTYGSIKVQAIKQNLNERVESTWKSFRMEPDPVCPIFGHLIWTFGCVMDWEFDIGINLNNIHSICQFSKHAMPFSHSLELTYPKYINHLSSYHFIIRLTKKVKKRSILDI